MQFLNRTHNLILEYTDFYGPEAHNVKILGKAEVLTIFEQKLMEPNVK